MSRRIQSRQGGHSVNAGRLVPSTAPVLRQRARDADLDDPRTAQVAARCALALDRLPPGTAIAIAAPQIGASIRVVVFQQDTGLGEHATAFANPVVTALDGPTLTEIEGCLSLPGRFYTVDRPSRIRIGAYVLGAETTVWREWETGGLAARAWFHEVDHLDGRLISDHGVRAVMRSARRHLV